jgi:hypothetical protein
MSALIQPRTKQSNYDQNPVVVAVAAFVGVVEGGHIVEGRSSYVDDELGSYEAPALPTTFSAGAAHSTQTPSP